MDRNHIIVTIHGRVLCAEFPEETNICVKMNTSLGDNWSIISGDSVAISSFSFRGNDNQINIDLPFEISLKSTTPFYWPRLVFTCFSKDRSENDSLKGYGCLFLPTMPGRHIQTIHCFLPEPSSTLQRIMANLRGLNAEFVNPLMPSISDGRGASRTSTKGKLEVELNMHVQMTDTSLSVGNGLYGIKPKKATIPLLPDLETTDNRMEPSTD